MNLKYCLNLGEKMKKVFLFFTFLVICYSAFSQATDAQVQQAAKDLAVPYAALKEFVDSYKSQTVSSEIITIDSTKLYEEYTANEFKADAQYKGKTLRLSGQIKKIGKGGSMNQYYIELVGDSYFGTYVYVKNSEISKLHNYSPKQDLTIIGQCDGKTYGQLYIKDSVIVNN